jgi:uncharacterized protein YndB with AHSA1/START domain
MIKVEKNTIIQRPIEEVFARIVDLLAYSNWMSKSGQFHGSGLTSPGPVGLNSTYLDRTKFGTFRGVIVEFERPRKVVFREKLAWLKIPVMQNTTLYDLKSSANGTELRHTAEGQLFGAFKIAQPFVAGIIRGERERTLNALKQSLENSH